MKKRLFALLMAVALIATNTGIAEFGMSVVHAAASCGTEETDHKNVKVSFKWAEDKSSCTATITCEDCDYKTEKKCSVSNKIVKAATCTENGEREYTAQVTFAKEPYEQILSDSIKATGHKEKVTKEAKAATCTEDGNTKGAVCSVCNAELAKSETIKATGHKEKIVAGKAPTCTEAGYTEETVCSTCNAVLKAKEVLPAKHEYVGKEFAWSGYNECLATIGCEKCDFEVEVECSEILLQKIAPTCTEDGYDYYTAACEYDGEIFMSSKMGDESTIKPKLGHNYVDDKCTRCELEKPLAEIVLVKTQTTKTYTGEAMKVADDIYEVKKGSGEVSLEYYLDEACTVPTYAGDEGKEASAPSETGVYFVKAVIAEDEDYKANDTEDTHKLIIRPGRVGSLKAVNNKSTIKLTWEKNEQATGYIIYRKTDSTEYEPLVVIEDASTLSFSDDTIKQGTKYRYNIVAYKMAVCGEEVLSLKRSAGTNIVRTKITSVTNQNGSVRVKWTKVKDVEGYKVYRKASGETKYTLIKDIKGADNNAYTDKGSKAVRNGKASYYYVVPYYKNSSNVVLKTNSRTNYYMARSEISSLATSGSGALKVTWGKNSSAKGYEIRYSDKSDMKEYDVITVSSSTLSKTIKNLGSNKTYYVQVRSYKTYNDVKYYSGWCTKKSKKTK